MNSIIQNSTNWSDAYNRLRNHTPVPTPPEPKSMGIQIPEIKINWQAVAQSIGIYTLIYIKTEYRGLDFLFLFISLYASLECVKAMIRIKNQPKPSKTINQGLDQVPDRYSTQVENARAVLRSLERKSGVEIL